MSRPMKDPLAGERGAALVEFSISIVLILTMLFGMITFGLILSFKQGITQATAEGTRAGAVSNAASAATAAQTAAERSAQAFDKSCATGSTDGLDCTFVVADCTTGVALPDCITVTLTYDYAGHPLLPPIPLISEFMPATLTSESVAQVNG